MSYDYARPSSMLNDVRDLIKKHGWDVADAFAVCTSNPGNYLQLKKGEIKEGRDADIVVLNENIEVQYVFGRGEVLKTPTWTKKAMCTL